MQSLRPQDEGSLPSLPYIPGDHRRLGIEYSCRFQSSCNSNKPPHENGAVIVSSLRAPPGEIRSEAVTS